MAYAIQFESAGAGLGLFSSSSADQDQALPGHRSSPSIQQKEFLIVGSRSTQPAAAEETFYRSSFASSSFQHRLQLDPPEASPVAEAVFLRDPGPVRSLPSTLNIFERSTRPDLIPDRYQEQQQHIPNLWEASTSARSSKPSIQGSPLISALPEAQLLLSPPHHIQPIVPRNEFDDDRNPSEVYRAHKVNAVNTSSSPAAGINNACKECGNQAKKDCQFQRCRTCCKSRSFDCQTHIKSTWVPASHRRNRDSGTTADALDSSYEDSGHPRRKRSRGSFRIMGSAASASSSGSQHDSETPHSVPSFGGRAAAVAAATESFPPVVRAHAVFRCVKLTSVEDGEDEYAYQTSVKIGGHIFKGVLHDRGIEARQETSNYGTSNNAASTSHQLVVAKSLAPSATVSGADPAIAAATAATATLYGHGANVLIEEMQGGGGGVGGSNW